MALPTLLRLVSHGRPPQRRVVSRASVHPRTTFTSIILDRDSDANAAMLTLHALATPEGGHGHTSHSAFPANVACKASATDGGVGIRHGRVVIAREMPQLLCRRPHRRAFHQHQRVARAIRPPAIQDDCEQVQDKHEPNSAAPQNQLLVRRAMQPTSTYTSICSVKNKRSFVTLRKPIQAKAIGVKVTWI